MRPTVSTHPLYKVWDNIKQRTSNPKSKHYAYYGAKGVKLCPEWDIFVPFMSWAVRNGWVYGAKLEIDRIDPTGDYEPINCRVITRTENMRNLRTTKLSMGDAKAIKYFLAHGVTPTKCAHLFGVTTRQIYNVRRGRSWGQ